MEKDLDHRDLNHWVHYIGSQAIPVFNITIQSVLKLTMDDKATCKQLADIIMRDASLTSRVIRVANSPYYNRCHKESGNIRRIILLIGFKKIAEICLTLSILDSLTDKSTQSIIYNIIAKSYHAAVQSRSIAEIYKLDNSDNVYLAALLNNIGEISFWSLTNKAGPLIFDEFNQDSISTEQAQENILGTTFRKLSLGLAQEWGLSDLLKRSLSNPASEDVKIKCIQYGYEITESLINKDSNIELISEKIAKEANIPLKEVRVTLSANTLFARDTYHYFIQ